jgi:DNA-damage-inducible protein J
MVASALVQVRIDADVKERAAEVLDGIGLTVSDVMRIVLTRVANEGALPAGLTVNAQAHDAWFRAKVREALDDPRPALSNEEVEAHFAKRRAAARQKRQGGA